MCFSIREWSPSCWSASIGWMCTTRRPTSPNSQARKQQSPGRRLSTSSTSCWVQESHTLDKDEKMHASDIICFPSFGKASLIRGNRSNCALFCDNLDWLVSKLDRLEASSGITPSLQTRIYEDFLQKVMLCSTVVIENWHLKKTKNFLGIHLILCKADIFWWQVLSIQYYDMQS